MRRYYDAEFKKEAIRLVKEGRRIRDVERSLGITIGVIKHWIEKEQVSPGNTFPEDENKITDKTRIKNLEKEVDRLRRERDILKKAAAYFSMDAIRDLHS